MAFGLGPMNLGMENRVAICFRAEVTRLKWMQAVGCTLDVRNGRERRDSRIT